MKGKTRGTSRKLFSLYNGVAPPIGSYYRLLADGVTEQGRLSVSQRNKYSTLLVEKRNKK